MPEDVLIIKGKSYCLYSYMVLIRVLDELNIKEGDK